ncbi:MAG: ABC transporter substrate-binding protein [bacterium]
MDRGIRSVKSVSLCVVASLAALLVAILVPIESSGAEKVKLLWWSHWAEEENKKAVILQEIEDYQKAHPNVEIGVTWWQKAEMWPAMRNTFTAGVGFPDIFYFDIGVIEFIEAGWIEDLSAKIDWGNVTKAGKDFWTRKGPGGKEGIWAVPLEASTDHIYYNVKMFDQLGIKVPPTYQFTAEEFYDVCKKIRSAGYDPFAQGIGDRNYPGQYIYKFVLLHQLGADDYLKLWNGKASWENPEVISALNYVQRLIKIPVMPKTYTTMKLAESHRYFHTEQKAAMFLVGAWYTGRAFVPPEKGGQPVDFRLSFLKYPAMPGGRGNDQGRADFGGALAVASKSKNKDVAVDVVSFFTQEKYANLWLAKTAVPTGLRTNPATMPPTPWNWYFEEYEKVHRDVDWRVMKEVPCGDLNDAYTVVFNEGLPQDLMTVDEAIKKLEFARKKCM